MASVTGAGPEEETGIDRISPGMRWKLMYQTIAADLRPTALSKIICGALVAASLKLFWFSLEADARVIALVHVVVSVELILK